MTRDRVLTEEEACGVLQKLSFDQSYWFQWRRKWRDLRGNASRRGCVCLLTFRQYMKLAKRAGIKHPDQIGKAVSEFQMGRLGDVGDYVWGNCRFITTAQNLSERALNGGDVEIGNKLARGYHVTSPRWVSYIGNNLRGLCRIHGLDYSCMKAVCGGIKEHHKGWVGTYVSYG